MKLIAYNAKTGKGVFECANCANMDVFKRRVVKVCKRCGHADAVRPMIMYQWRRRAVGYSRLIPPEDIERAKQAMRRAEKHGVEFNSVRTIAGLKVQVVSVPNQKQKEDQRIWESL